MTQSPPSGATEPRIEFALKIGAGSSLWQENTPPGEDAGQIASDLSFPVWVRREDEWAVRHLLRFWNRVSAQPVEEQAAMTPSGCPDCGGSGLRSMPTLPRGYPSSVQTCVRCGGTGKVAR